MIKSGFIRQYHFPFIVASTCQALWMGAVLYGFPMYTNKLIEYGLKRTDVLMFGVLAQTANGLTPYVLHLVYQYLSARYSLRTADRLVSGFLSLVLTVPLFGIGFVLLFAEPSETNINIIIALFGCIGLGNGGSFAHMVNVVKFNFTSQSELRRVGLASLSVSAGLGALAYVVIYRQFLEFVALPELMLAQASLGVVLGIARTWLLVRDKDLALVHPEAQEEVVTEDEPVERETSVPVVSAPIRRYRTDPIVWLTCLCSGFGVAIGAAFVSSIGNLATSLTDTPNVINVTFWLSICFISSQTVSRIVTAYLYARWDNPYIMTIWQLCLLFGAGLFTFHSTTTTAIITAVAIGFAFGGVWSAFPVIVSESFPGTVDDYMKGLSLIFVCIAVATLTVGQIQRALLDVEGWSTVNYNAYFSVFLFYFSSSILCVIASIFLSKKLKLSTLHQPALVSEFDEDMSSSTEAVVELEIT